MTSSSSANTIHHLLTYGTGVIEKFELPDPKSNPKRIDPECKIQAFTGPIDSPRVTIVETKVTGTKALHLVRKCEQALRDGSEVVIKFALANVWAKGFMCKGGPNAGKPRGILKADLAFISEITVDGVEVYKTDASATDELARDQALSSKPSVIGTQAPPAKLPTFADLI
jgi:Protein of unknown function (DUF3577)